MDKPTILVVEDEPAIADTIQYALESEGFRCLRLEVGAGVVELLERQPVALVVLDIGLPDVSGIEVCRRIRQRHEVPVIFLTARADEVDRVVGLELGADDYVTKPFSPRELAARAKAVLRRAGRGGGPPSPPPGAVFALDEERHQITYFGKPLELSRYEYRLLAVLLKKPGRVYSREQLLELVWDEPEASLDRTVDAHVKNLRAKLRDVRPDVDPIATHRGTGYGNPFLLHQALENLVQNAIEFSPRGGTVRVEVTPEPDRVTVAITDQGPGIPDYALDRIFDRFYSLGRPDTGKKSTGLGLNLVREVAKSHGGTVRVVNRPEGGALAELTLPRS